jgi:hypothetical protein
MPLQISADTLTTFLAAGTPNFRLVQKFKDPEVTD